MAKITLYVPDQPPAKYALDGQEAITIGRSEDCLIQLDHASVSGTHAVIRQIGGGMHVLEDQNSTNGVFLEGEKVTDAPLGNGASFMIGEVSGEYEGDVVEQQSAPAEHQPAADSGYEVSGGGGYGAPIAAIAQSSSRPPGFTDMSPVEKVEKKDSLGKIAMLAGTVALLAAIVLVFLTVMMNVN